MKHEKTWLTCKEAGDLINRTQRQILNIIKSGKLSAERDDNGKYLIQKSEFFRLYPDSMNVETTRNKDKSSGGNEAIKMIEEKLRHSQEINNQKDKLIEVLLQQIDVNIEEKSKMLDTINNNSRLLVHQNEAQQKNPICNNNSNKISISSWWPFKRR